MSDARIDIKNGNEADNIWFSACCKSPVDRRVIIYFSRLAMSFILIFFCLYKLSINDSSDTYARYMSLLTFIIGLNFPSLQINKNNK